MSVENQLSLCTDEQKVSYGLGRQFGEELSQIRVSGLDLDAVIAGMEQAFLGQPSILDGDELNSAYEALQAKIQIANEQQAAEATRKGVEYLEKNAKRNGVQVTESGLQYEVLAKGEGEKAQLNSTVVTHYTGQFPSGDVFDSSLERGQPAEFPVTGVIAGWTEALQLMSVGDKWRLVIPSDLAYGTAGAGGSIPPNAVLVFELELLEIK